MTGAVPGMRYERAYKLVFLNVYVHNVSYRRPDAPTSVCAVFCLYCLYEDLSTLTQHPLQTAARPSGT